MTRKPGRKPQEPTNVEGTVIHGDVHAGTFIGHDQINYNTQINITTAAEFTAELHRLQAEILAHKPELKDPDDAQQLDLVVKRIQTAIEETEQPQPVGERIRTTLEKAQATMTLLKGTLDAAVGLGTTLGGLALIALKLFGG